MTGGVNHVQGVGLAVYLPGHAHGLRLDGNSAFALNIHAIQVLGTHRAVINHAGQLQHAVGQG